MPAAVAKKPLTTDRQKELLRVIESSFTEFAKRGQTYYTLDGMSTAQVTLHAIQDFETLQAFWPTELVRWDTRNGKVYQLNDDTMSKVQSSVRDSLKQLSEKGWIEQAGNIDERRWRYVKPKPVLEKKDALDPSGVKVGYYERTNQGPWTLHLS
jgi:hypothetical protein